MKLPALVEHWLTAVDRGEADPKNTNAYAQLILAFAMARLGDERESQRLQNLARARLRQPDLEQPEVHAALLDAFEFRIGQLMQQQSAAGPLPADWLARVEHMDHTTRYKVDKLRQYSRVLEPHVKIDPYRRFQVRYDGDLDRALVRLQDVADRQQLHNELRALRAQVGRTTAEDKERWGRVLAASLVLAPRVGEALAEELLAEVTPACDLLANLWRSKKKNAAADEVPAFLEQANLLEKGLFLAAHFDRPARVQEFVSRFRRLLQTQQGPATLKVLNTVADQSFRGLRKLGLRDEIDQVLREMADLVLRGRDMTVLRDDKDWPAMLTTLLRVADGWFYFGKEAEANAVIEEARRLLYGGNLERQLQQQLALAYAMTLAQAPVEQALHGIEELFGKLKRAHDVFFTKSHYGVMQLALIESVVLAVVSEDFAVGRRRGAGWTTRNI